MWCQSKMWSWNQDYFEGLKEIGEAYAGRNDYERFSEYCLIKEAGLKKKANAKANDFVTHISLLSVARRREIIVDLAELNYQHPKVHSLINHPIQMMMQETLRVWTEEEPDSLLANRWYGFYGGWSDAFEAALRIDPYDHISLSRLTTYLLNDVDYATHHLNESFFIGSEKKHRKI